MKGQSLLSKVFGNSIKNLHIDSKAAKVALNTLFDVGGEMLEEATSEAINPLLQTITYDPTAMPDNVDEYFQNIFEAAIEAIPSTLLMEGMGGATNVIRIGKGTSGGASSNYFTGNLYSIRVYNRKLTQEEMLKNQQVDNKRFNLLLSL